MIGKTSDLEDLAPVMVQARRQLEDAKRFLEAGDLADALNICRELLTEHAEYVGALYTLGRVYMAEGQYDSALPCFIRASMLRPDESSLFARLAETYCELQADEAAIQAADEALALKPDDDTVAAVHLVLGRIYQRQCDYLRAIEHLEKALASKPDLSAAGVLLGQCHVELGERKQATKAYDSALKNDVSPLDQAQILGNLACHANAGEAKKILTRIDKLKEAASGFESGVEDVIFQGRLELARAAILESLGQHDDAWAALEAGNAPLADAYRVANEEYGKQAAHTIERARDWIYAGSKVGMDGKNVPVSLLIIGPSRSGKSTLERLVGSMKGVVCGFDNELIQVSVEQVSSSAGLLPLDYPGQLPTVLYSVFSEAYAAKVTQRAGGAKLFTTTHPGVILDLGRIVELVPNVRVVFVERETDDTALRIFGKMYPESTNPFAYSAAGIYEYLEGYAQLTDVWSKILSDITMRVSYEDMIADPKQILGQISEFCDLPAPKGKLPDLGDDRGCGAPYRAHLSEARK